MSVPRQEHASSHPGQGDLVRRSFGAVAIDWPRWLRQIERKRRLLSREVSTLPRSPRSLLARITENSFILEGIALHPADVSDAIATRSRKRGVRSGTAQRIRNHFAILEDIERGLRAGQSLRLPMVLRWYTMLGNGLSTTTPAGEKLDRLEQVIRRINFPHLRLQPAISEVAQVHVESLADALVPSFHGIVARLILHYHLGRCGLCGVAFDPRSDGPHLLDEKWLTARLLQLLDQSYDLLLLAQRGAGPLRLDPRALDGRR